MVLVVQMDKLQRGLTRRLRKTLLGSVQNIPEIPQNIKDLYKTVWEISQKAIIDMAADRGAYVCQSQSMNVHIQDPNFGKLTSMHFHAWKKGLKTVIKKYWLQGSNYFSFNLYVYFS